MTLLLDTNTLIWWLTDDSKLGKRTFKDISNATNQVYVSDIVLFECAIKLKIGKLRTDIDFQSLDQKLAEDAIEKIAFDAWSAEKFVSLPLLKWADPFDMAHISLAIAKHMILVTSDHNILTAQIPHLQAQDSQK